MTHTEKEEALTVVNINGLKLNDLSTSMKDDEDVVLTAVKNNFLAFSGASNKIKQSTFFFRKMIENNISLNVMRYAGEKVQGNKEIGLICVQKNGNILDFLSDKLKNDFDIVLAAVKDDGYVLKYASEKMKDNEIIFSEAVKKRFFSYKYGSLRLKENLKNIDDIYTKSVQNYIFLMDEDFVEKDLRKVIQSRFENFLKENPKPQEFYKNQFFKLDDLLTESNNKDLKNGVQDTNIDDEYIPTFIHILSFISAKNLINLDTNHSEIKKLINEEKIRKVLNNNFEYKPKKKDRILKL